MRHEDAFAKNCVKKWHELEPAHVKLWCACRILPEYQKYFFCMPPQIVGRSMRDSVDEDW